MSGFFMDWDGNLRSVEDPSGGYVCEVDLPARYVAVMKGPVLAHEATLYKTLEAVQKAGINAELVTGSHPCGRDVGICALKAAAFNSAFRMRGDAAEII